MSKFARNALTVIALVLAGVAIYFVIGAGIISFGGSTYQSVDDLVIPEAAEEFRTGTSIVEAFPTDSPIP